MIAEAQTAACGAGDSEQACKLWFGFRNKTEIFLWAINRSHKLFLGKAKIKEHRAVSNARPPEAAPALPTPTIKNPNL